MPGNANWEIKLDSNIKQMLSDALNLKKEMQDISKGKYEVDVNIDEKKIDTLITNINNMLKNLGNGGSSNFKQLDNLTKEIENIKGSVAELQNSFHTLSIDNSAMDNFIGGLMDDMTDLTAKVEQSLGKIKDASKDLNIGDNIADSKSFEKVIDLFSKMEASLSSIKGVLVDVGDGEELSPLLSEINHIETAVEGLSSSLSNLHFNMNINMGSDNQMDAKIQEKAAKALNAYEKLFNGLKMSGYGGEVVNNKFFDFDINQFDTTIGKVKAYIDIIERLRKESKEYYGGSDLLRSMTDDKLWRSASSAGGQLTKALNESVASKGTNSLGELFGKTDLSGVINQLTIITEKLDTISTSAKSFSEILSKGLNVNTSVQEITDLTNRVKELETELAKVSTGETNISNGNKIDEIVSSAKDLGNTLSKVDISTGSFDEVLKKLDRTKSELIDIVKITKQSVSDTDGKFHDSYTLKDSRGSTEIYGMNSKTDKGQILRQNIVTDGSKKIVEDNIKSNKAYYSSLAKDEVNYRKLRAQYLAEGKKQEESYQKEQSDVEYIKQNKAAYDELTEAIRQYSEVSKRVSSGKTEDGDLEKMTQLEEKISQLQKQPILSESQVNKSEKLLITLYDQLDKIERKLQETNQGKIDTGLVRLDSYQNKYNKYQDTLTRFKDGGWTSDAYAANVDAVEQAFKRYNETLNNLRNQKIVSPDDIADLNQLEQTLKGTISTVQNMSAAEKGFDRLAGQKELDRINKILEENSRMSTEAKAKIQAYYDEISSGNPSASLGTIHGKILEIVNAEQQAGRAGKSFLSTIKDKAWYGWASQLGGMVDFFTIINGVKEVASTVTDLNSKIVDLAKVSEDSVSQIYADFDSYADIAKDIGGTISDTIDATAAWSKNGYNIPDSKELARVSQLYKNVGDNIDIDSANESLISTLKGFQLEADQAEHIVDVFNEVSNNEAISSSGIGDALQNSAAAFNAANTSLEKSVALVTATRLHRLVEYMETYIKNIFNCHRSLYYYVPQYRG